MHFYYLDQADEQQGPLTAQEIRQLWLDGVIGPNTLARTDRIHQWQPITSFSDHVPGFILDEVTGRRTRKKHSHAGYRHFRRILYNPVELFAWLIVFGIVLGFLRQAAVTWVFPPNKAPAPPVDVDTDIYGAAPITPLLYRPAVDGMPPQVTLAQRDVTPDSVEGTILRGLLGPQRCIRPDLIIPLPASLPRGRFYTYGHNDQLIFSAADPDAQLAGAFTAYPTAYTLPALKIASGADEFRPEIALPRITSYSQLPILFSTVVGSVEGALLEANQQEWTTFNREATERGPYLNSVNPTVRRVELARHGDDPAIAVAFESRNRSIAISDLYPPEDTAEGARQSRLRIVIGGKEARSITRDYEQGLKEAAGLPPLQRRKAIADASPYVQLVFAPHGTYVAGILADGRVRIYNSLLKEMATLEVDAMGPYILAGKTAGRRVAPLSSPRVTFDAAASFLVGCNAGNVFVFDLRTRVLSTVSFPGRIDTCTVHRGGGQFVAASAETGEVYLADIREAAKGNLVLGAKSLVAGLGPLVSGVNFSRDGETLSAVFDERIYGNPTGTFRDDPPAVFALFWNLAELGQPPNEFENRFQWFCKDDYATSYPSHEAAFVSIARRKKENRLVVLTHDPVTKETREYPLRALSRESQRDAILMHSLVQYKDSPLYFNPRSKVSYSFPASGDVPLPGGRKATGGAASKQPTVVWRRTIVGGHPQDKANDLAVDSQGNIVVCGDAAFRALMGKGYVWKYSPTGEKLWEFCINDAYPDAKDNAVHAIEIGHDDAIYFVGTVKHEKFGSDNLCYGKLSPNGRLLGEYRHEKNFDGRGSLNDIVAIDKERFAIGGHVYRGFHNHDQETSGTFIGVIDDRLRLLGWQDDDSGPNSQTGTPARYGPKKTINGLSRISDGGLAVTGNDGSVGDWHTYVQRRAGDLAVLWSQRLPCRAQNSELCPSVVAGQDDSIYVAFADKADGDREEQMCVLKYSLDGKLLWQKNIPSRSRGMGHRMTVTPDGSLLVAGNHNGNAAVVQIRSNGTVTRPFYPFSNKQSSGGESFAVAFSPDGSLYVAGRFQAEDSGPTPYTTDPSGGPMGPYMGRNSAFVARIAWGDLLDAP